MDGPHATTEDTRAIEQVELAASQTEPDSGQQEEQEPIEEQELETEALEEQRSLALTDRDSRKESPRRTVVVLWDLDNVLPGAFAAEAVESLRRLASRYGEVTAIHAYANRNAFLQYNSIFPPKHSAKRSLQPSDDLPLDFIAPWEQGWEQDMIEEPSELRCGICGQKQKTQEKLQRHMKSLHERERAKKAKHIAATKSAKKKAKLWNRYEPYLENYSLAAIQLQNPGSMGMKDDLEKAGVKVKLVSEAAEAADGALRRRFKKAIQDCVGWVLLVSDDKGFVSTIQKAKKQGVKTLVVGTKKSSLSGSATSFMSWQRMREVYA